MSTALETTENTVLDGRVRLIQPAKGYRAGMDTIFLAAAVPARAGERVFEAGSGVGGAALCLAARVEGVHISGLEIQPEMLDLANANVAANGLDGRIDFTLGDIAGAPATVEPFDHVMMNPPYHEPDRSRASPVKAKRISNTEGEAPLGQWIGYGLGALRPRGSLTLIHRADRLGEVLAAVAGQAGEVKVFPLWPGGDKPAKRVIVRCRKGLTTPLSLLPGLVLHGPGGAYTDEAQKILRDGEALDF